MYSISSNHVIVPSTTTSIPSTSSTSSSKTSSFEGLMAQGLVSLVLDYLMIGPNFTIGYDEIPKEVFYADPGNVFSFNKVVKPICDRVLIPEAIRKSLISVIKVNNLHRYTEDITSFNFPEINKMIAQCKATVEFFGCNFSVYKERLLFLSHVKFKEYNPSTKEFVCDQRYCLIQNLREWMNGRSLIISWPKRFITGKERVEIDFNSDYFSYLIADEAMQTVRAFQEVGILEQKPDINKNFDVHYLFNYRENELLKPKLVVKQLKDSDLEKDLKKQNNLKKISELAKVQELDRLGHNLCFTREANLCVSPFTGIMQIGSKGPKPILLLKWEGQK